MEGHPQTTSPWTTSPRPHPPDHTPPRPHTPQTTPQTTPCTTPRPHTPPQTTPRGSHPPGLSTHPRTKYTPRLSTPLALSTHPPCGQTHTCKNMTLATTSLRPVIIQWQRRNEINQNKLSSVSRACVWSHTVRQWRFSVPPKPAH